MRATYSTNQHACCSWQWYIILYHHRNSTLDDPSTHPHSYLDVSLYAAAAAAVAAAAAAQPLQLPTWLSQHEAASLMDAVTVHANLIVQAAALRCSTTTVPTG